MVYEQPQLKTFSPTSQSSIRHRRTPSLVPYTPGRCSSSTNANPRQESSPYNVWTPAGGKHGTIVANCGTLSEVFINEKLGAPDAWVKVPTPEGISYTRTLLVLPDPSEILITGAGELGGEENRVTTSSIDLDDVE
ncbi:hypothetical protein LTR09_008427 [Extremus antarcticus]|uniref:Uncharacterized protein n=1 Tax=Extremus antarcticus TaxID=702011 RepID=A0AAJ0DHI3_9PEZI|nr:hypothetical protein LTR09_008427 [Extremus antarcticus]